MQINVHKNANAGYYPAKMNEAFLSRIKFQETDEGGNRQHFPIACTPALSTSRAGRHLPRPYGERDIGSA